MKCKQFMEDFKLIGKTEIDQMKKLWSYKKTEKETFENLIKQIKDKNLIDLIQIKIDKIESSIMDLDHNIQKASLKLRKMESR